MLLAIAGFLVFLVALLALPVSMRFAVQWPDPSHRQVTLGWLFGLVRISLHTPKTKKQTARKKKKVTKQKDRKKNGNFRGLLVLFQQKRFQRRIRRFVGDCIKAIHTEDLNFSARIGLNDPADTGRLWAFIGPLAAVLTGTHAAAIRIEPEFTEQTIAINGHGMIRLVPLQFLFLLLTFVLSPATLRAGYAMYKVQSRRS